MDLNNKNFHKALKDVCNSFMTKVITIESQEDESWLKVNWFSRIRYEEKTQQIILGSDKELLPYLLELKGYFTEYKLWNAIRLKSAYSIRIYELLKQYEKIGRREIELDQLKEILSIPKTAYKLYADFKRKIILLAQKEINGNTDIKFEFEENKWSRQVHSITFNIYQNTEYNKQLMLEDYEIKEDKKYWFDNPEYVDNIAFNREELEEIFIKLGININEAMKDILPVEQFERFYTMQEVIVKMYLSKAYNKKISAVTYKDIVQAYDITKNKKEIDFPIPYMEKVLINLIDKRFFA